MKLIDKIRETVKGIIKEIAIVLNAMFQGRLMPNHVTIASTLLHLVIAAAIITEDFIPAAVMLIAFGLMDSLDGALARIKKVESDLGMVLDASTDRIKEVILYSSIAYLFAVQNQPEWLIGLTVLTLGGSIIASYVKAKGETAVAANKEISAAQANRIFIDGFWRYEIRMSVLVIGLLFNQLPAAIIILAIGSWQTTVTRFIRIYKYL